MDQLSQAIEEVAAETLTKAQRMRMRDLTRPGDPMAPVAVAPVVPQLAPAKAKRKAKPAARPKPAPKRKAAPKQKATGRKPSAKWTQRSKSSYRTVAAFLKAGGSGAALALATRQGFSKVKGGKK